MSTRAAVVLAWGEGTAHCGALPIGRQGALVLYSPGLCRAFPARSTYVHASEHLLSPILVRPVREQLEHDRVIRLLQAKYKKKFEVSINPGNEQTMPVGPGPQPWYPDLVLQSSDKGRKLLGVVEVETAESVNHLEAMSQWATFSRLRAPFHLYVPASSIDTARLLCSDLQIPVAEVWAYHALGDQMRFTLVQRLAHASDGKARGAAAPRSAAQPATRRTAAAKPHPRRPAVARPARRAAPAKKSKTASRAAATRKKASSSSKSQKRK